MNRLLLLTSPSRLTTGHCRYMQQLFQASTLYQNKLHCGLGMNECLLMLDKRLISLQATYFHLCFVILFLLTRGYICITQNCYWLPYLIPLCRIYVLLCLLFAACVKSGDWVEINEIKPYQWLYANLLLHFYKKLKHTGVMKNLIILEKAIKLNDGKEIWMVVIVWKELRGHNRLICMKWNES